jgi:hypothetical protein
MFRTSPNEILSTEHPLGGVRPLSYVSELFHHSPIAVNQTTMEKHQVSFKTCLVEMHVSSNLNDFKGYKLVINNLMISEKKVIAFEDIQNQ